MFVLNKITNKYEIENFIQNLSYTEDLLDLENINLKTIFNAENVIQIFPERIDFDLNYKCNILNQDIRFDKLLYGDREEKEWYFPKVLFTWSEI